MFRQPAEHTIAVPAVALSYPRGVNRIAAPSTDQDTPLVPARSLVLGDIFVYHAVQSTGVVAAANGAAPLLRVSPSVSVEPSLHLFLQINGLLIISFSCF